MSNSQLPRFIPPSKKFALSLPINPLLQGKIKSSNLRLQLQDRMVDLGNLQTEWATKESQLRTKSEDLITQLKTISRKNEIAKNEERAKHLQLIDQLNRQHQMIVLDLQSQINDSIDTNQDDNDISDIELRIENIKKEISEYESLKSELEQERNDILDEEEEKNEKIEMLDDRLKEMENLYSRAVQTREEESKTATHQLQELILKQQEIDQQNQQEIQQLVDKINRIDLDHADQIADIKKKEKEIKRNVSQELQSKMTQAVRFQQEISKFQHEHKRIMNQLIDEESQLKQEFGMLNSKHSNYLYESTNAAKKCSDEKRRIAAMKREIEELNAELLRETIEHTNLMKEANKIDDEILNQVPENASNSYSLSFSYNRF